MRLSIIKLMVLAGPLVVASCAAPVSANLSDTTPLNARWPKGSAFYCIEDKKHHFLEFFAGKVEDDGRLKFGLSIWEGQNITIFGIAAAGENSWDYTEPYDPDQPDVQCKIKITLDSTGAPTLTGDPEADCHGMGGSRMAIGVSKFKRRNYAGLVTDELDDLPAFFNAGRCA